MACLDDAERAAIAAEAGYDLALRFALEALRKLENGGPQREVITDGKMKRVGGEFGVQSEPAPTFAQQLRCAARSWREAAKRYDAEALAKVTSADDAMTHRGEDGLFRPDFLRRFARRYDPTNPAYGSLLVQLYGQMVRAYGPEPPPRAGAAARVA